MRPVLKAEAAVDGENLAGNEVGGGSEEQDGLGDIVGGAVALHRCAPRELLELRVDFAVDDHAGGDAVDADFRSPGFGHGAGEHVEGGFRGAVVGMGGPGMEAAERADVDDASVGGFEVRVRGLGDEERGAGIGFKHPVPLLDGDAFEGGGFEVAGIVDEDVETAELDGDGFDGGANLCGVA